MAEASCSSSIDFTPEDVYSSLPPKAISGQASNPNDEKRKAMWDSFLVESIPGGEKIKAQLSKKANYENLTLLERMKKKKKKRKSRASVAHLNTKTPGSGRKAPKLTNPSSDIRFETFVPLCEMWTSYIDKVIDISRLSPSNQMDAATKLMKADLHGCPLIVQKSKCPSYIGVSGIVIQETRNVFVLVTRSDKVKRIPKKHSIFSVVLGECVFSIHGNHFLTSPGNRAGKKFKAKATIDL